MGIDSCHVKTASLHIGLQVRHPEHGLGTVKAISETSAEIVFTDGRRTVHPETSDLQPAEPQAAISGLIQPLQTLIKDTVEATLHRLGIEKPGEEVHELARKWNGGTLVFKPADPALQPKDIALDVFFHKILMMRNNLRVLEQKVNSHEGLTSAEKYDWQQYITRCYGSMSTFNVLFRDSSGHFGA